MRSVAEYLGRAAEFDELARSSVEPALKKQFADIAGMLPPFGARAATADRDRLYRAGNQREPSSAGLMPLDAGYNV